MKWVVRVSYGYTCLTDKSYGNEKGHFITAEQ